MYNGIGLNTPRGSGTSGHVVRNASALRPRQSEGIGHKRYSYADERSQKTKPIDQGIIEHERKRHIEIKCLELQDELEDKGLSGDEIASRVDKLRQELLSNIDRVDISKGRKIKSFETQRIAEAKDRENQQMAKALRIRDEHVEGEAFDQELQDLRRQKLLLQRELEKEERSRKARDSSSSGSEEDDSSSGEDRRRRRSRHGHRSRNTRMRRRRSRSPRRSADSPSQSSGEESRHSDRKKLSEPSSNSTGGSISDKSHEERVASQTTSPAREARLVENGEPGEIEDSE
ncbi:RNA-splicing factor [Coemansia sp. IMI 203386]|nr:RNA-splicing factor [Coemansia sp. IMI 203386]